MNLKLLANENFPLPSVKKLRASGFDIVSITELSPGISDDVVLQLARLESRILLTFDKDYGELIYLRHLPCPPALVYLRFTPANAEEPAEIINSFFSRGEEIALGYFTVLDRDSFRRRPLPKS